MNFQCNRKLPFPVWMAAVDALISAKTGLSSDDLPDMAYDNFYAVGMSAKAAAGKAIRNAKS